MSEQPTTPTATPAPAPTQQKKGICCACPDTKKARDECFVMKGEENCKSMVEAHLQCLRKEGFNV